MISTVVTIGIALCAAALIFQIPRRRGMPSLILWNSRTTSAPRGTVVPGQGREPYRNLSLIFESLVCQSGFGWIVARVALALLPVVVAVLSMMALMRVTPL